MMRRFCGNFFSLGIRKDSYKLNTMSYDNFALTFSNSRKNLHWPELEYIIKDLQKFGYRTVLDIGCGNGRFLGEIEKL